MAEAGGGCGADKGVNFNVLLLFVLQSQFPGFTNGKFHSCVSKIWFLFFWEDSVIQLMKYFSLHLIALLALFSMREKVCTRVTEVHRLI